jgi:hypothetical protein
VGSSSSERIIVESICKLDCEFDDTLPLPTEVEREFLDHAGDGLTALAWLADHGIDSAPPHAALIQYGMVWNPETGRYQFMIYSPDHIGPKHPPELAVPIIEDGTFVPALYQQRWHVIRSCDVPRSVARTREPYSAGGAASCPSDGLA